MVQSGYNKQGVHIYMTRGDYNSINQGFHPLPKVPQYARRGNSCQDEARPTMLRFHNSVKKQFQLYNAIKLPICLYEEARIVWSLEHERTHAPGTRTQLTQTRTRTHPDKKNTDANKKRVPPLAGIPEKLQNWHRLLLRLQLHISGY